MGGGQTLGKHLHRCGCLLRVTADVLFSAVCYKPLLEGVRRLQSAVLANINITPIRKWIPNRNLLTFMCVSASCPCSHLLLHCPHLTCAVTLTLQPSVARSLELEVN